MKQPKFFIKSTPTASKTEILEPPSILTAVEAEPVPVILKDTFPMFSRAMFGIGAGSIFLLLSLSTLPTLLKSHPLPQIFNTPDKAPAVLVQKGGAGIQTGLQFDARLEDGRIDIVSGFLSRYNSPLKPAEKYGRILVEAADRYGLDYRLLPAIMMQESNLCKTADPAIHNCLGFGIHSRGTLAFDSYEASFDRAARELKQNYIDKGYVTPNQIMTKYTPSSNGSWANSVNQWIAEMEFNSRQMGLDSKQDMDLTAYSRGK